MQITRRSLLTGEVHTREVPVTEVQLTAWRDQGVLIQRAMPDLPAADREFLKTGITPEEWAAEFGCPRSQR